MQTLKIIQIMLLSTTGFILLVDFTEAMIKLYLWILKSRKHR